MEQLEGEGIKETFLNYLKQFKEWLKPNSNDTLLVKCLKMIYKIPAAILFVALSPVLFLIFLFVFFAAL